MKRFAALLVSAVLFVACGDDSSSSASAPVLDEDLSSSSVESNNVSSSSAKSGGSSVKSSSSVTPESSSSSVSQEVSSSSTVFSSSSAKLPILDQSSSSVTLATPCKTKTEDNCEYGEIVDERDGRIYKTVKIGDQVWMAENLNYFDETLDGRSWCYEDDLKNCETWGRLYTWAAAIDSVALYDGGSGVDCGYGKTCTLPEKVQGICPKGWHLPTNTEWQALFTENNAGKVLKAQTGWYSNGNGTDAYGFAALSAGGRDDTGTGYFDGAGSDAYFWSATEGISYYAHYVLLIYNLDGAYLELNIKDLGFSVRCLKDNP